MKNGNKAYHHLVERNNIELHTFTPDEQFEIAGLSCLPVEVDHRNENADTVGLLFEEKGKQFYYMPDLDYWTEPPAEAVRQSDVAMIDGTFYAEGELSSRIDVPHPFVTDTMDKFEGLTQKFTLLI